MIRAIFFDFNGVIIDDEPLYLKAYQQALAAEDIALTEADYYDSLGMDDDRFVRAAFERAGGGRDDEALRRVQAYASRTHRELISEELPLSPGVVTFIKALARRLPLGVVSMARRADIEYVLERARLKDAFTVIVSAEDVTACKPDPTCYQTARSRLNQRQFDAQMPVYSAGECLVIEDSPPGIQSARAAGMHTLGVTNTVRAEALRAAGADVVTHSLADWTVDAVRHVFSKG